MRLDQKIKEIMDTVDKHEKSVKLAELSFILEMDASLNEKDIIDAVEFLIEFIIKEKNQYVKDDVFNVIDDAVFTHHIGKKVNWQPLVDNIEHMSIYDLIWIFPFLAISRDEKYIPLLLKYVNNKNVNIQNYVIDAIAEIKRKVSSSSPEFKKCREEVLSEIRNMHNGS